MSRNAERLVVGLRRRGVRLPAGSGRFSLYHVAGQAGMNKAAGEAAPTWYLEVDRLVHTLSGRIAHPGAVRFTVEFEGRTCEAEVCSHMPLSWLVTQDPSRWEICWDDLMRDRLNVWGEGLPPGW